MSNQVINAHIMLGSPCGDNASLAEVADWAGDLILEGIDESVQTEIAALKAKLRELDKAAEKMFNSLPPGSNGRIAYLQYKEKQDE